MMRKKIITTAVILFICAGSVFSIRAFAPKAVDDADKRTLARSKGEPTAPLQIIKYFDYECPACRTAHETIDAYIAKYPGQIFLQVKFYPLPAHRYGLKTALYAECAVQQNKFWKFHDLLFQNQKIWSALPDAEPVFKDYAKQAGMDLQKCEACVKDPRTEKTVMEEKGKAMALGIRITPSSYVNGKLCPGYNTLKQALQEFFGEPVSEAPKSAAPPAAPAAAPAPAPAESK